MTFSREDRRKQLRARCCTTLFEQVEAFADEHGETNSDVIRDAVREYLPDDADMTGPKDTDLRETWQWLRDRVNDRNRIRSEAAVSELAQAFGMKEQFVKSSRLKPLERKGWVRPNYSHIEVIDRD